MLDKRVRPDLRLIMNMEGYSKIECNKGVNGVLPQNRIIGPSPFSVDAFFAFSGLNLLVPAHNQESDMIQKQRGSSRFFIVNSILSGSPTLTLIQAVPFEL